MKLFLCWSNQRGLKFANACKAWLEAVIGDQLEPELSMNLEKGRLWFEELTEALREARIGIICLTPEGISSPWIHFEAGILAKSIESNANTGVVDGAADPSRPTPAALRIFPLLYGVDPATLKGPLGAFQSTSATDRDDAWRLIESILSVMPEDTRPKRKDVKKHFNSQWNKFQLALQNVEPAKVGEVVAGFEDLFKRKTFDESMYECLTQGWLERYTGTWDVKRQLGELSTTVRKACRPFVADVFDALLVELNAYAMCLSVLIGQPAFPIDAEGKVAFAHRGVAEGCERRRRKIKSLVARLADESQRPVFDEAYQFQTAETFAERKRLIHRRAAELRGKAELPESERCQRSDFDFDRVMHNVWLEEHGNSINLADQLATVRRELEKAESVNAPPSLIPLYYSLGPVRKALATGTTLHSPAVLAIAAQIRGLIERTGADQGGQVRRALKEIERLAAPSDPSP